MKQGKIDHWSDIDGCNNLLFFAELVNELLFDYSIPSNRISTLNCHYLCKDALDAINGIENHGVPQGTLKPIMEELYSELGKAPSFKGDKNPLTYFIKYHDSKAIIAKNLTEMNYYDFKRTTYAINKVFFSGNSYYEDLKTRIIKIVKDNENDKQQDLYRLTKSMLTELNNTGYDLRYIYRVMHQVFWNKMKPVNSPDTIDLFFSAFDFIRRDYNVVFRVKHAKMSRFLKFIDELKLQDDIQTKCKDQNCKRFLTKKKDEKYLTVTRTALDPFSAEVAARFLIEDNIAVYRLFDHNYTYRFSSAPSGIFENDKFYRSESSINAVKHKKTPTDRQIDESLNLINLAINKATYPIDYHDLFSLLSAIKYHSHSLDSYSEENQLLDFWAIFETVLDISNEHTADRINQVCLFLVPILKRKYIFSLFDQLADDIRDYDLDIFKHIVNNATDKKEIVQKICEFVLLPEKELERKNVTNSISNYPLLIERILYYGDKLKSPKLVHAFVEKHAERVKWQVMRVYRNRNLIIHNGEKMPYLNLLIENLHSYVDDFLSYTIHNMAEGNNFESMFQGLFISECNWNAHFSNNNSEMTSELIKEMLTL